MQTASVEEGFFMVNKVILIGNLGQDPEIRTSQAGNAICNLRIATSTRRRDPEGNWNEQTEWHSVVCFGRTAENVGRFLKKGRQVFIEGRLQTRKWQDREGKDRWTTEIVAEQVRFLGSRDGDMGSSASSYAPRSEGSGEGSETGGFGGGGAGPDDDIPF
jgi:single-strand DNA-binding protein